MPKALWSHLDGRLWHATESDSLSGMISDGEIGVGVRDRYRNSFCRYQDGVCLFDFGPTAVNDWDQFGNWVRWFGHEQETRIAIWLKIDRAKSIEPLLDARAAHEKWHETPGKTFIPGVEACHRGPIPLAAVVSALLIARDKREMFQQVDELNCEIFQQIAAFELELPPVRPDNVVEALWDGRRRSAERAESARKVLTHNYPDKK